jgi:hypothetical protein
MMKMKIQSSGISFVFGLAILFGGSVGTGVALEQPRKFDEFANVTCEDEMARLDNFTHGVLGNPEAQGYIIVYGGRRGRRNEAKARAARLKYYLVKIRGMESKRIVTLDGGFREQLSSELWIVRPGDSSPLPTPTIDPKEVRLRGTIKIRGYNCGAHDVSHAR